MNASLEMKDSAKMKEIVEIFWHLENNEIIENEVVIEAGLGIVTDIEPRLKSEALLSAYKI